MPLPPHAAHAHGYCGAQCILSSAHATIHGMHWHHLVPCAGSQLHQKDFPIRECCRGGARLVDGVRLPRVARVQPDDHGA